MVEKRRTSTPADRQIWKLESLRVEKDRTASKKPPKHHEPSRAAVERTLQRLELMREMASQAGPAMPPVLPPSDLVIEPRPKASEEGAAQDVAPVVAVAPPPPPVPPAEKEDPGPDALAVVSEEVIAPPALPIPESVVMMAPPPPPPAPVDLLPPPEPPSVASAPPPPPAMPDEPPVVTQEDAPEGEMHPSSRSVFPRFDGRYKNVKLSVAQMKTLEQLFEVDPRLYPARILRLALNQWLGMKNLAEDQALEPLSRDALIRIQKDL